VIAQIGRQPAVQCGAVGQRHDRIGGAEIEPERSRSLSVAHDVLLASGPASARCASYFPAANRECCRGSAAGGALNESGRLHQLHPHRGVTLAGTLMRLMRCGCMIASNLLMAVSLMATTPSSLAALRWEKRVLIVSAPDKTDPLLSEQRRILSGWQAGAEQRDLVVVEIIGDRVIGTGDAASALRQRYKMPSTGFTAALIGKDGGTKLHQKQPITSAMLEKTIDAMPMRRAEVDSVPPARPASTRSRK
jgi:hypothetical protein